MMRWIGQGWQRGGWVENNNNEVGGAGEWSVVSGAGMAEGRGQWLLEPGAALTAALRLLGSRT